MEPSRAQSPSDAVFPTLSTSAPLVTDPTSYLSHQTAVETSSYPLANSSPTVVTSSNLYLPTDPATPIAPPGKQALSCVRRGFWGSGVSPVAEPRFGFPPIWDSNWSTSPNSASLLSHRPHQRGFRPRPLPRTRPPRLSPPYTLPAVRTRPVLQSGTDGMTSAYLADFGHSPSTSQFHPFPPAQTVSPVSETYVHHAPSQSRAQPTSKPPRDDQPPDLFSTLNDPPSEPPESDLHPDDPDMIPHEQDLRFPGDLYTPRWVRGQGNKREGWCGICKPGRWLVLKNSAFWYDKSFSHGISATTGQCFAGPVQTRRSEASGDGWEGLCSMCGVWCSLMTNKKKATSWFRHAYKCHAMTKSKEGFINKQRHGHGHDFNRLQPSGADGSLLGQPNPTIGSTYFYPTPTSTRVLQMQPDMSQYGHVGPDGMIGAHSHAQYYSHPQPHRHAMQDSVADGRTPSGTIVPISPLSTSSRGADTHSSQTRGGLAYGHPSIGLGLTTNLDTSIFSGSSNVYPLPEVARIYDMTDPSVLTHYQQSSQYHSYLTSSAGATAPLMAMPQLPGVQDCTQVQSLPPLDSGDRTDLYGTSSHIVPGRTFSSSGPVGVGYSQQQSTRHVQPSGQGPSGTASLGGLGNTVSESSDSIFLNQQPADSSSSQHHYHHQRHLQTQPPSTAAPEQHSLGGSDYQQYPIPQDLSISHQLSVKQLDSPTDFYRQSQHHYHGSGTGGSGGMEGRY